MTLLNEADVRTRLRLYIGQRRLRDVAAELDVSVPWLSLLLGGGKKPGGKVLDALGLERTRSYGETMYREKQQ